MKIIRGFDNIKNIEPSSITIGNFDGVHLGHKKILKKVKKKAKDQNLKSGVVTFYPHPIKYFKPGLAKNFLINNLSQKLNFFKQNSLDYVFLIPFNKDFANIEAKDFVEKVLCQKINAKEIVIGYDFIFGKNREGNYDFLKQKSEELNFGLEKVRATKKDGLIISSSAIRDFLRNGKIKKANEFLGKNYLISGSVINGEKIGREVGFRTANVKKKKEQVELKFGVYKTEICISKIGKKFKSITNFGIRPTFGDNLEPIFETHIFGYENEKYGDLYGQKIDLKFIDFIREERKFESVIELQRQIERDIEFCRTKS